MIKIHDPSLEAAFHVANDYISIPSIDLDIFPVIDDNDGYRIELIDGKYHIFYSEKHLFFEALINLILGIKKSKKKAFSKMGVMIDCARNAVPNVASIKRFIINLAFLGYDYLALYLEDCLEVIDEPYFGYMRGRYSKKEMREIIDFASMFGIEVIPFIQTLAHIDKIFHHYYPYKSECFDIDDILLMDNERTYSLIENIIKTIAQTFDSKFVHIGLDEAFHMTLGEYQKKHRDFHPEDVFMHHVKKVCDICKKYGLSPIAWGDMFLKYPDINVPEELIVMLWNYDLMDKEEYFLLINKGKQITENIAFASGAKRSLGYAPLNEYSKKPIEESIKACRGNINHYIVTSWGDDGAECSFNALWYSYFNAINFAHGSFLNKEEVDKKSLLLFDYRLDDLLKMDLVNNVFDVKPEIVTNVSKYILYSDLLMGISDRNESIIYNAYFLKHKSVLAKLAKKNSYYSYLFKEYYYLADLLSTKCNFRNELLKAYHENNKEEITHLLTRLDKIILKTKRFYKSVLVNWEKDNKTFGIEVINYRLSGLIGRMKYVKGILRRYLNNEIKQIMELDEKNLSPRLNDDNYNGAKRYSDFEYNVTYGALVSKK